MRSIFLHLLLWWGPSSHAWTWSFTVVPPLDIRWRSLSCKPPWPTMATFTMEQTKNWQKTSSKLWEQKSNENWWTNRGKKIQGIWFRGVPTPSSKPETPIVTTRAVEPTQRLRQPGFYSGSPNAMCQSWIINLIIKWLDAQVKCLKPLNHLILIKLFTFTSWSTLALQYSCCQCLICLTCDPVATSKTLISTGKL